MKLHPDYIRSALFGFEDSLVSTTGVVAGLAAGSGEVRIVLLGGIVAVTVEALSMGAGQYLSQQAAQEAGHGGRDLALSTALVMFVAYATAGAVPLLPLAILPYPGSLTLSIAFAFLALFTLGYVKGRVVGRPASRSGAQVLVIGGIACILGIVAGLLFKV